MYKKMPIFNSEIIDIVPNFLNDEALQYIQEDAKVCRVEIDRTTTEGEYFAINIYEDSMTDKKFYIERPLGTNIGDILYFEVPEEGDTVEYIYYVHYVQ